MAESSPTNKWAQPFLDAAPQIIDTGHMLKTFVCSFIAALIYVQSTFGVSQVTLNWDQSSSTNVSSQRLYYSNTPVNPGTGRFNAPVAITLGLVSATTVGNLADGTYYFAVTARDAANLESVYSNIVTKVLVTPSPTPSPTPPSAPTNLRTAP